MDLRQKPCVDAYFPPDLHAKSMFDLKDPVVLQITNIYNVAQPDKKKNETNLSPSILLLQLSDGHSKIYGVEMKKIPSLKASLPPGTKIRYHGGKVVRGRLLLTPANCEFLGGRVSHIFEAWQVNTYY